MSDDATPRLALPYLAGGQAQKHLTLNEALAALDGLVQTAVRSRSVAAEPVSPADGDMYVLPPGRTGPEWALHPEGALLRYEAGGWTRLADAGGMVAWVEDEAQLVLRGPAGWGDLAAGLKTLNDLDRLGVGTAADAENPLAAKLNKALFTARTLAEGGDGDLRYTLNKEAAPDVLSLLLQTGFSGRAELGLVGDDRFALKVSADGAAWTEALRVEPGGQVRQPGKPAAAAWMTAPLALASSYQTVVFDGVLTNAGGAYAPSTGVFTCPVAGLYRVSVSLLLNASTPVGGGAQVQLRRNGASVAGAPGRLAYIHQGAAGQYLGGGFATVVACDAGDQLTIAACEIAAGSSLFGGDVGAVSFEFAG